MKNLKIIFLSLAIITSTISFAQSNDSVLIKELVKEIAAMQVQQDGKDFYAGQFPSFRECAGAPHNYQPDNNVFFTAISAFTLKNLLSYVDEENKKTLQSVIDKAVRIYPYYQNRYGYPYYNFWPTHKPIMPHTYYFKYLKSVFGQGEDSDDSVMILLGEDNSDSASAALKKQLIKTANLSQKKIISTFKKYRNIPAYSTWLGLRMTPDFDFAVQCNILYFMLEKKLPLVKQDTATIYLLQRMIANKDYMKSPVYISPYYVHSSILLYHIARLLGKFSIPELDAYKPQLIADIQTEISSSNNIMDQIILRTALLRLGVNAPELGLNSLHEFNNSNKDQFVFFQARAAFSYPTPFKQIFLHWSYINYYFYCPVYNKILLLEYLVEKNKRK